MPKVSACVVHEWGSILVLHRRNPKLWEFAVSGEGTEAGAVKAAKEMMSVDLAVKKKLLETETLILYQAEVVDGIPKPSDEVTYDRIRYIEIPILWKKPDELSPEVRALLEAIKQKKLSL